MIAAMTPNWDAEHRADRDPVSCAEREEDEPGDLGDARDEQERQRLPRERLARAVSASGSAIATTPTMGEAEGSPTRPASLSKRAPCRSRTDSLRTTALQRRRRARPFRR